MLVITNYIYKMLFSMSFGSIKLVASNIYPVTLGIAFSSWANTGRMGWGMMDPKAPYFMAPFTTKE